MAVVEQVRADPSAAPGSAKLEALLQIASAVVISGHAVAAEHVTRARAAGATDREIHDTVLIAATFCMFNRYVDGLATIAPDDPAVYAAGGQRLITHGYLPPPADPSRQEAHHRTATWYDGAAGALEGDHAHRPRLEGRPSRQQHQNQSESAAQPVAKVTSLSAVNAIRSAGERVLLQNSAQRL
jgi:hypothetical protein